MDICSKSTFETVFGVSAICHSYGHLPTRVLNKIVHDTKLHADLEQLVKLSIISKIRPQQKTPFCTTSRTQIKVNFRIDTDFRYINSCT